MRGVCLKEETKYKFKFLGILSSACSAIAAIPFIIIPSFFRSPPSPTINEDKKAPEFSIEQQRYENYMSRRPEGSVRYDAITAYLPQPNDTITGPLLEVGTRIDPDSKKQFGYGTILNTKYGADIYFECNPKLVKGLKVKEGQEQIYSAVVELCDIDASVIYVKSLQKAPKELAANEKELWAEKILTSNTTNQKTR